MRARTGMLMVAVLMLAGVAQADSYCCFPDLVPELVIAGTEDYEVNGQEFTRYYLNVPNWQDIPAELFTSAPDLPPCGQNQNSARSWVRIYAGDGSYIYGFCALSSPASLNNMWFAVSRNSAPPADVYIVIWDRRCDIELVSASVATLVATEDRTWGRVKATYR